MNSNVLKLIDIAARLPYGDVEVEYKGRNMLAIGIADGNVMLIDGGDICWHNIANVKPYLRPLSSMTEEERRSYEWTMLHCSTSISDNIMLFEWLNARHFDYRGLIGKGLALAAPDGMY